MFGRLRPPPSPPDCLERYPAKIMKDDPLSVYESTLLKLKQGSRLDTVGPSSDKEGENLSVSSDAHREARDATLCNGSDAMAIDSGSGEKKKNPSVLSMFCKYRNQAQARDLSDTTTIDRETENALC